MHALLCNLNYLLTRRSNGHQDHNTSPLREVQTLHLYMKSKSASAVNSREPNNPNSFILAAPPNRLCHYGCLHTLCPRGQASRSSFWLRHYGCLHTLQGIKPLVLHPNELRLAQSTSFFAAMNPSGWGTWISQTQSSWRTAIFNWSFWSSSQT